MKDKIDESHTILRSNDSTDIEVGSSVVETVNKKFRRQN